MAPGSPSPWTQVTPGAERISAPGTRLGIAVEMSGTTQKIDAQAGETLLTALRRIDAPLLAVCGGRCICGTCRIGIAPLWRGRLPPMAKGESRLLACLPEARDGDRLACQIRLSAASDGLEVKIFG